MLKASTPAGAAAHCSSALPWPPRADGPALHPAALRTRDEPPSRSGPSLCSGPSGGLRCSRPRSALPTPRPSTLPGAGEIVFTSWFTYFVIAYFLVSVSFWLYRLQSALSKYDPLFIIPLLQASYIVFATVGGAASSTHPHPSTTTTHSLALALPELGPCASSGLRLAALGGSAPMRAQPPPRVRVSRLQSCRLHRL